MILKFTQIVFLFFASSEVTCFRAKSDTGDRKETVDTDPFQNLDPILYSYQKTHNKFTIQSIIEQRDEEKRRNPEWWKAYFAELLAATILLCAAIVFFFWYRHAQKKYGPITIPVDEEGRPYLYIPKQGRRSVSQIQNNVSELPLPIVGGRRYSKSSSVSSSFPKCSKPACVCAQPEMGRNDGGKGKVRGNRWYRKKVEEPPEVYAPAS